MPNDRITVAIASGMAVLGTVSITCLMWWAAELWRWTIIPILLPVWVVVAVGVLSPTMRDNPDRLDRLALIAAAVGGLIIGIVVLVT